MINNIFYTKERPWKDSCSSSDFTTWKMIKDEYFLTLMMSKNNMNSNYFQTLLVGLCFNTENTQTLLRLFMILCVCMVSICVSHQFKTSNKNV